MSTIHRLLPLCRLSGVLLLIGLPLCVEAQDRLIKQDWWLLESEYFTVVTNTRGQTPENIIGDLELFRAVVLAITGIKATEDKLPTRAVVFKSLGEFNRIAKIPNIAGYMRPSLRGNRMVSGGGSLSMDQRLIMFHEYVHHLLRSASSVNYASWYDEGLADMLSTVYEKDGRIVIGAESSIRMKTLKNNPMQVSLERIVNTDDLSSWHPYHLSYFYAMSWAFVNYLNVGHLLGTPNRLEDLQQYLAFTQEGIERPEAFVEAFGMTPRAMQKELDKYLGRRMRPVLMIPRDRFPQIGKITKRLLSKEEITYELAMLAIFQNTKLARSLLEDQLRLEPENPRLTGALALTYQAEKDFVRGATLARQAARADPSNPELAIDLADLLVIWNRDVCTDESTGCDDRVREAERAYYRALELAPDNPEAHAQLAALLHSENQDLAAASEHIRVGLEYQPWSPTLNLLAGQIYQGLNESDSARVHLKHALYWTDSEEIRIAAAEALAELESTVPDNVSSNPEN